MYGCISYLKSNVQNDRDAISYEHLTSCMTSSITTSIGDCRRRTGFPLIFSLCVQSYDVLSQVQTSQMGEEAAEWLTVEQLQETSCAGRQTTLLCHMNMSAEQNTSRDIHILSKVFRSVYKIFGL